MEARHVQADEIRVKVRGGVVWMGLAVALPSRLWAGGVVSRARDGALVTRLLERVRACATNRALLLCVDGFAAYVGAARAVFRAPVYTGMRGRPRLALPEGFLLAQVVKSHKGRRLAEVTRRVVVGTEAAITRAILATRGGTQINTAYIERLNATFRARLSPLTRRGRGIAHGPAPVESGMWLVGCAYNFCWAHESLRLRAIGGRKWQERTPAMAAGAHAGDGGRADRPRLDAGRGAALPRPASRAGGHDDTATRTSARSWSPPSLPGAACAPTDGAGRMTTLPCGGTGGGYPAFISSEADVVLRCYPRSGTTLYTTDVFSRSWRYYCFIRATNSATNIAAKG